MLRGDDFGARPQKGMADELDDFVRAVAEDDVIGRDAELFRKRARHVVAASVRIEVGAFHRRMHRFDRARRRPEGVFVRGQLDDVARAGAEFARRFLDRFARLINGEVAQLRICAVPDRSHACGV